MRTSMYNNESYQYSDLQPPAQEGGRSQTLCVTPRNTVGEELMDLPAESLAVFAKTLDLSESMKSLALWPFYVELVLNGLA